MEYRKNGSNLTKAEIKIKKREEAEARNALTKPENRKINRKK